MRIARLRRHAGSLVGILVVVAMIALVCVIVIPRYVGQTDSVGNKAATAPGAASDVVCRSNLAAVRQAVAAYRVAHVGQGGPATLSDIDVSPTMTRCSVGGESYTYNSATSEVHCPHPGHEGF